MRLITRLNDDKWFLAKSQIFFSLKRNKGRLFFRGTDGGKQRSGTMKKKNSMLSGFGGKFRKFPFFGDGKTCFQSGAIGDQCVLGHRDENALGASPVQTSFPVRL
jgi:hypothetical protein